MELYREIEKTFPIIEKVFSQEELLNFKNMPIGELCLYHYGLGTWIRNQLLYSKDNRLWKLFLENGIESEDEMSFQIIGFFHYYLSTKM